MKKSEWLSNKIAKIMREGVRKNTHRKVSKVNPRRKVSVMQASAIAHSMYKNR
jgi:hypothetical protein